MAQHLGKQIKIQIQNEREKKKKKLEGEMSVRFDAQLMSDRGAKEKHST